MPHHHVVDLHLQPHEASGLVASQSERLKQATGLRPLFWTVLDDGPVQECIALIGRREEAVEPTAGWATHRLSCEVTTPASGTDDGEAIAAHDGWVYVLGSHYGSKDGPLEPERSFIARFHEDDVALEDGPRVDLHVASAPFLLHQVVNDALRQAGVDLLPAAPKYRKRFVAKARRRGLHDGADWAWRLRHDDWPINIEGAAFLDDGALALGLRVPVTGDGNPLVVVVRHVDRMFDPAAGDPEAAAVWTFPDIGSRRALVGIRDLQRDGDTLHLLVGNLDSDPDDSLLLRHHPEGGPAESAHWRAALPRIGTERAAAAVAAEHVHTFEGLHAVEGLAADAGRVLYVSDEDRVVRTRFFGDADTRPAG